MKLLFSAQPCKDAQFGEGLSKSSWDQRFPWLRHPCWTLSGWPPGMPRSIVLCDSQTFEAQSTEHFAQLAMISCLGANPRFRTSLFKIFLCHRPSGYFEQNAETFQCPHKSGDREPEVLQVYRFTNKAFKKWFRWRVFFNIQIFTVFKYVKMKKKNFVRGGKGMFSYKMPSRRLVLLQCNPHCLFPPAPNHLLLLKLWQH